MKSLSWEALCCQTTGGVCQENLFTECWLPGALEASYFVICSLPNREGDGNPLQCSCLENPRDGGAWWAAVHGVTKSQTRLSDFIFTFHFHALEKEMATHSSVLAWGIPGTGEPGGLLSGGSHRDRHDWSDLAAAAAFLRKHTETRRHPLPLQGVSPAPSTETA